MLLMLLTKIIVIAMELLSRICNTAVLTIILVIGIALLLSVLLLLMLL